MAGDAFIMRQYRNYDSNDTTLYDSNDTTIKSIQELGWSAPSGKVFKEWNSSQNGDGTVYQTGDVALGNSPRIYAIWEDESHAVTISYQNSTIATMDATGVKTLLTGATFCEDDIVVSYTAPSGPSGSTTVTDNGTYDISQYASVVVAVPSASGVSF